MKVSNIITDLINSSWLNFIDVVLDPEYGYLLSLNPVDFNIQKTNTDTAYITIVGDTLPGICQARYETVNYAPLIFFLNDTIEHPLYIPPNIEIWLPDPSKIYTFLRDMNQTQ
jgi:hypothetical protein